MKNQDSVRVLVRAFSILEVIAGRPAGIGLGDLSRSVGLHKSTAFRMVRTMTELGYLVQADDTKFYCIGDRLADPAFRPRAKEATTSTAR